MTLATKGRIAGVGALGVLVAVGGVAIARERATDEASFSTLAAVDAAATIECEGSIVELDFDPGGRIEARVAGETVAAADSSQRRLNRAVCAATPTQRGWFVGVRYARAQEPTTLTCRFPGRFSVHAHPVFPSWAGDRPAGSAVYLVLERRLEPGPGPNRTIVASASVVTRTQESVVVFTREYCTTS